jgi:hypothetical protein
MVAILTQKGDRVVLFCVFFTVVGLGNLAALYFCGAAFTGKKAIILFLASGMFVNISTSLTYSFYFTQSDYYKDSSLSDLMKKDIVSGGKILDVNNAFYRHSARAYGFASLTSHWFSPPSIRQHVFSLADSPPSAGLTYDSVDILKYADLWPKLRAMHVQFVVVPFAQLRQLASAGKGADWEMRLTENSSALLEVLYDGARLSPKHMLHGKGYRDFSEGGGRVTFISTEDGWITVPVRHYPGWEGVFGVKEVRSSPGGFLNVLPEAAGKPVALGFFPVTLYPLLAFGAVGALLCLVAGIAIHACEKWRASAW